MRKKRVAAATVGCKVNFYDTEVVLKKFEDVGYEIVDFKDEADVYIVNTCSVTNLADKKSRQILKRAKNKNSDALTLAIGCSSQLTPKKYEEIGADIVLGTSNRLESLRLVQNYTNKVTELDPNIFGQSEFEATNITKNSDKTRAFLKLQDGCNNFCTFCIIPYARGVSRSRPFEDVIKQARIFAENGYKEIVVAGIHIESYGKDLGEYDLVDVLQEICQIDGIKRVRLSSVEPSAVTPKFLDFIANNPKFCEHLHLSLQSGSDRILKLMNRKYTTEKYSEAINSLRNIVPNISLTTDIIAGFPFETEEEHKQTCDFVNEIKFSKLHVFPFSPKEGTQAAKMPNQIETEVKKKRVAELLTISNKLESEYNSKFVGQTMPVLVEKVNKLGYLEGKTGNYLNVIFEGSAELIRKIVSVRIDFAGEGGLFGKVL